MAELISRVIVVAFALVGGWVAIEFVGRRLASWYQGVLARRAEERWRRSYRAALDALLDEPLCWAPLVARAGKLYSEFRPSAIDDLQAAGVVTRDETTDAQGNNLHPYDLPPAVRAAWKMTR